MCTRNKNRRLAEMSIQEKQYYESLVGHTPFSFFKNLSSNIEIFDYFEDYAVDLVKSTCEAINQEFPISYEYLINPKINAGCVLENNVNKIIVFEGVIFSLYSYAHKLVTHYKTVRMKKERENSEGCTIFVEETRDGLKLNTEIELSSRIEDNILAEYIAMMAVKFIIAHEIGHILSGHLLYRSSYGEEKVEFHMTSSGISKVSRVNLQCMEIDADSFAACELVSSLEKELLYDGKLLNIIESQDEIYKIAGCAIQCVFYLIGKLQNNWRNNTPEKYSHPPAITRVNLLLDVCRGVISDDKKWGGILQGCVIAERNLNDYFKIGNDSMDQFIIDIIGSDKYGQHLLGIWRDLKKELAEYTKLPFI